MILDGEDGFGGVPETFEGSIVEVDVGGLATAGLEGRGIDREAMILRSDFDFSSARVLDGLVAAAMAKFEFVGFCTEGKTEKLMPKADTEDGFFPDQLLERILDVGDGLWVTWPVGDEYAIRIVAKNFFGRGESRDDSDAAAGLDKVAKDVAFKAAVNGDNVMLFFQGAGAVMIGKLSPSPFGFTPRVRSRRRDDFSEIETVHT